MNTQVTDSVYSMNQISFAYETDLIKKMIALYPASDRKSSITRIFFHGSRVTISAYESELTIDINDDLPQNRIAQRSVDCSMVLSDFMVAFDKIKESGAAHFNLKFSACHQYHVDVLYNDDFVRVAKSSSYELFSQHDYDFYPMDPIEFPRALRAVSKSMAKGDVRYYLNGAKFETLRDGELTITGTDGHRLCTCNCGVDNEFAINRIIKSETIAILLKAIGRSKYFRTQMGIFNVEAGKQSTVFKFGRYVLVEKNTIDGRYPDWQRVIPVANTLQVHVDINEFKAALKIASGSKFRNAGKFGNIAALQFDDGLKLESFDSETLETTKTPISATVQNENTPFRFAFNVKYMVDALAHIELADSKRICIELSPTYTGNTPLLIRGFKSQRVVMPCRE